MKLQQQLKRLTKTTDWITDPIIKTKVYSVRGKLFPKMFPTKEHKADRLIDK